MSPLGSFLSAFARDSRASAAAEMALVTPLLMILMLGTLELGFYFFSEHIIVKAVRDGSRFAGRQAFTEYSGCAVSSGTLATTRNLTRTGRVGSGATPRLYFWTDPASISVTVTCNTTGTYRGIYRN